MRKEKVKMLTNDGQGQATIKLQNNEFVKDTINVPNWIRTGKYEKVMHKNGMNNAGFDLTTFHTAENFIDVLDKIGLDYCYDYYRVDKSDENENYYHYVWGNGEGLIVLDNNPITGEYKNGKYKDEGYASYIGISGNESFVNQALEVIKDMGNWKDIDIDRRSYL